MYQKRSWSGVEGELHVELYDVDGRVLDSRTDVGVPHELGQWAAEQLRGEVGDLWIRFVSSGFYDPGRSCGPPERCYPPMYEDVRAVLSATLTVEGRQVAVPAPLLAWIEDWWSDAIYDVELSEE
jgi:hypothetical protein